MVKTLFLWRFLDLSVLLRGHCELIRRDNFTLYLAHPEAIKGAKQKDAMMGLDVWVGNTSGREVFLPRSGWPLTLLLCKYPISSLQLLKLVKLLLFFNYNV